MGIRVLLVDDEEELVSALEERLALRGIDVVGVTRGAEAVQRIQAQEFDVVVLDVKMPDMSGLEAMKRMKALRPSLPVILFTGHGSLEASDEAIEEGASEYLAKPIDIEELVAKIKSAARSRS